MKRMLCVLMAIVITTSLSGCIWPGPGWGHGGGGPMQGPGGGGGGPGYGGRG